MIGRGVQLNLVEQLINAFAFLRTLEAHVEFNRTTDDLANRLAGVQSGIRHLIDHLRLTQLFLGPLFVVAGQDFAVKGDFPHARRQKTGNATRGRRFPRTGFTHHGHGAACMNVKADVVQNICRAVSRRNAADGNNRRRVCRYRSLLGSLELTHRPEGFRVILFRGGQHCAGVGLLDFIPAEQNFDLVRHLRHHGEVVGDVDRGCIKLFNDLTDRGEDFDLRGHIERGGRFVEDDQVRAA